MPTELIEIDSFEPDYKRRCDVCGASPTVTAVKDGKEVYSGDMCGPCTWGEVDMLDPLRWNE